MTHKEQKIIAQLEELIRLLKEMQAILDRCAEKHQAAGAIQ